MLQNKSFGMARTRFLVILPLLCTAVLAFAENKNILVGSKDCETSQNMFTSSKDTTLILINGEKIDSMMFLKNKDEMNKNWKTIQVKDGVFVKVFTSSKDTTQILVNGEKVESPDNINVVQIESKAAINNKNEMKEYGKAAQVKDRIVGLPLKDKVEKVHDYGSVLFVLDGKVAKSIDGIDNETIESISVIRNKKEIKKYGKASKGKDIVIDIKLKK